MSSSRPSSSKAQSKMIGGNKRPLSAPSVKIPDYSKIKSTGVASQPAPYKIVSASLRKNMEDKRTIERDNKTIEKKLEVHKTAPIPLDEENKLLEEQKKVEGEIIRNLDKEIKGYNSIQLLEVLTKLKKDVGDSEKENEILKANLIKFNLAEKKYQIAIDNINKFFGLNRENNALKDKYLDMYKNESKNELSDDQRYSSNNYDNNNNIDEIIESGDKELDEMLEEHRALQDIRRGLVSRIKASRDICKNAESVIEESIKRGQLMQERLQGEEKSGDDSSTSKIKEIQNLKLEIATLEATRENDLHIGAYVDQIAEIKNVMNFIKDKIDSTNEEIKRAQESRKIAEETLNNFTGNGNTRETNIIGDLYDSHALMRSTLVRLRRNENLESIEKNIDNLELEFLRHKLRIKIDDDNY